MNQSGENKINQALLPIDSILTPKSKLKAIQDENYIRTNLSVLNKHAIEGISSYHFSDSVLIKNLTDDAFKTRISFAIKNLEAHVASYKYDETQPWFKQGNVMLYPLVSIYFTDDEIRDKILSGTPIFSIYSECINAGYTTEWSACLSGQIYMTEKGMSQEKLAELYELSKKNFSLDRLKISFQLTIYLND